MKISTLLSALLLTASAASIHAADLLDSVKSRGSLRVASPSAEPVALP